MKEGIFVCPQNAQVSKDQHFSKILNSTKRRARKAFENICRNLLGNEKAKNYSEIVQQLITSHSAVGCNQPLKLHFLHSYLGFFPENMGAVSNEHGERFHQDISQIEKKYSTKWSLYMLADYCCSLIRETPTGKYEAKEDGVIV